MALPSNHRSVRGCLDSQKSDFLREVMKKEETAFEDFYHEYYQISPADVAKARAKVATQARSVDRAKQAKIQHMRSVLRENDTAAIKLSQNVWGNCNAAFDSSSTLGMSSAQAAMQDVYDPDNLDGIHTIRGSKRNNRKKNDFTEYVEANARYAQMAPAQKK